MTFHQIPPGRPHPERGEPGQTTCGHPWCAQRPTWERNRHDGRHGTLGFFCGYPLIICYIAIENDHLVRGFSHWTWWFSIGMLNYQRVFIHWKMNLQCGTYGLGHGFDRFWFWPIPNFFWWILVWKNISAYGSYGRLMHVTPKHQPINRVTFNLVGGAITILKNEGVCQWEGWHPIWVCLKIGYIPNYSHLIGIMIINHWV